MSTNPTLIEIQMRSGWYKHCCDTHFSITGTKVQSKYFEHGETCVVICGRYFTDWAANNEDLTRYLHYDDDNIRL